MVFVTLNAGKMQKEKKTLDNSLIKKENKIFLIFKEIQNGAVVKSYI
jgi:hypothetical protein